VSTAKKQQRNNKENNKEIAEQILDLLKRDPEITMKDLSEELKVTPGKIRYYIDILKESGLLEREGSTKKGRWIVCK
jgi:predicted HTH transcriptional regulator